MDRFEASGWLDWWANPSTRLGSIEVSVMVGSDDTDWDAVARVREQDVEEIAFLCDLDPVFVLRFADDSTIAVNVHTTDDRRQFRLTEYVQPTTRAVVSRLDL
ncbi:hypothetical protein BDK92_5641 [Micromonospora pisi]|uniref:Uncharacterized protein n=1 Tax=Micromonospora pisi TaxID=589240 RepID=A0A495JRW0_9ACTN|nr:hypothetical protein [Micromonospora pisi]RKR91248.1 hypothetical protein BDK92_5641 [Micromonospora pisi]